MPTIFSTARVLSAQPNFFSSPPAQGSVDIDGLADVGMAVSCTNPHPEKEDGSPSLRCVHGPGNVLPQETRNHVGRRRAAAIRLQVRPHCPRRRRCHERVLAVFPSGGQEATCLEAAQSWGRAGESDDCDSAKPGSLKSKSSAK